MERLNDLVSLELKKSCCFNFHTGRYCQIPNKESRHDRSAIGGDKSPDVIRQIPSQDSRHGRTASGGAKSPNAAPGKQHLLYARLDLSLTRYLWFQPRHRVTSIRATEADQTCNARQRDRPTDRMSEYL